MHSMTAPFHPCFSNMLGDHCNVVRIFGMWQRSPRATAPSPEPAQPHARGSLGDLPARESSKDVWGFSEHAMTQTSRSN